MEVAETLYGVTMAEPGVIRLVSVKSRAGREREGAPGAASAAEAVGNLARV